MNRRLAAWLVLGVIGWVGLLSIGGRMYAATPRTAGFDLDLLLEAGRNVAAGRSPYDPSLLAGMPPQAESLFYSYPPPIAQAASLLAGVPPAVVYPIWIVLAMAGLGFAAALIGRRLAPDLRTRDVVVPTIAVVPLCLPYAVGILFGNVDIFFPTVYGLLLAAVLGAGPRIASAAGVGLALASLKLHPASLWLWLLLRSREPGPRRALLAGLVSAAVIVGVSLLVGGVGPWLDYADVVRTGSLAMVVSDRNAGPAAQLALASGGGESLARTLQIAVSVGAVLVTVWAAVWRRDPVESLAWAVVASLVTLPVTWYHYPSALIPFGLAAVLRARQTNTTGPVGVLLVVALTMGAAALVRLPLEWVAVGLVLAAVRLSAGQRHPYDRAISWSPVGGGSET